MKPALADGACATAWWFSVWVLALVMMQHMPRLLTRADLHEVRPDERDAAAGAIGAARHHNPLCDYPRTGMVLTVVAYCPGRDLDLRTRPRD